MTSSDSDTVPPQNGKLSTERPVFIFGCCQRTGSTLVQRLLNSSGDMTVWGEHDGYLTGLMNGYYRLMAWKNANSQSVSEFLDLSEEYFMPNAIIGQNEIHQSFVNHVRTLFPIPRQRASASRWGFKEVRYTADVALFLQELFPQASFIHIVRKAEDCLVSMRKLEKTGNWQRRWTEEALANWIKINKSFRQSATALNNCHLLRYEDLNGIHALTYVEHLESFLKLPKGSLDRSVLGNRIDFLGQKNTGYRLTEEDRTLLHSEELVELHRQFYH